MARVPTKPIKGKPPTRIANSSSNTNPTKTAVAKSTSVTRGKVAKPTKPRAGEAKASTFKGSKAQSLRGNAIKTKTTSTRARNAPNKSTIKTTAKAPSGKAKVTQPVGKPIFKRLRGRADDDDMDADSTLSDMESDSDQLSEIDMEDLESLGDVETDRMEVDEEEKEKLTIFDLPASVRTQIYKLSGLVQACPMDLSHESSRHEQIRVWKDVKPKPKRRRSHWYHDRYDTCSKTYRDPGSDWPEEKPSCFCPVLSVQLLRVSKEICKEVTPILYGHNVIRISMDTKEAWNVVKSLGAKALFEIKRLEVVLGRISNAHFRMKQLPLQLEKIFDRIMKDGQPSQVDLLITSDIRGLRNQAMDVFPQTFGKLSGFKSCAVMLAPDRLPRVADNLRNGRELPKKLARGIASDLKPAEDPFPFFRLPEELRYQVLLQSELVFSSVGSTRGAVEILSGTKVNPSSGRCCQKCSTAPGLCVCNWRFMSMSTTCTCGQSPMELFLVNSSVKEQARSIFLSQNRFFFSGPMRKTLEFLSTRGPSFIQGLRAVDFEWPISHDLGLLGNADNMYWEPILKLLLKHAKTHVLEVCVRFQDRSPWRGGSWTQANGLRWDYASMVRPLLLLHNNGLQSCKMFAKNDSIDEAKLERLVMGDRYDSKKFGKLDRAVRSPQDPHIRKASARES